MNTMFQNIINRNFFKGTSIAKLPFVPLIQNNLFVDAFRAKNYC